LRYLDVSNNQIQAIEDLKQLAQLDTLDVSSNKINDWFQIEVLVQCGELVDIMIEDNPFLNEKTLIEVSKALPNVKYIDNVCFFFFINF
jgi:Leucine-rich repeat (LRR) protein